MRTHFPVHFRKPSSIFANKAIVCVRNPLDIVVSSFSLYLTGTHNKNIENDIRKEFQEQWDWFVKKEINTWKNFNDYWMNMAS